jgi:hypothetical protein
MHPTEPGPVGHGACAISLDDHSFWEAKGRAETEVALFATQASLHGGFLWLHISSIRFHDLCRRVAR